MFGITALITFEFEFFKYICISFLYLPFFPIFPLFSHHPLVNVQQHSSFNLENCFLKARNLL
jgi:hypothetical protein